MNKRISSCRRSRGLGLVELMVGMVIGMVTLLVVTQVMQSFEGQKRTSTGGNDAQTNGAMALYLLDREIRMAGYGVAGPEGLLCQKGLNSYYDNADDKVGPQVTIGGAFLPIQIFDGGDGEPDTIELMRSDAEFGAIPTSVVKSMPTPSSIITTGTTGGLENGDLFIMASKTGDKRCTLMQMTQDPQATGNGFNLQHNPGASGPYNPANPVKEYGEENTPTYEIGDIVINMGAYRRRQFLIQDDQLFEVDPMGAVGPAALVSGIVDLQAVYGVAPAGSNKISEWVPATGIWAALDADVTLVSRIRAVRLAIVARSPQYEKDQVTGASVELWSGGPSYSPTADGRHYRYKVFETIVPLRNVIWSAS